MGLDTTHEAWHGAYSAFARWRTTIADVGGFPDLDLMAGYYTPGGRFTGEPTTFDTPPGLNGLPIPWTAFMDNPLTPLLMHSDCDGWIEVKDLLPLAARLEELLPLLELEGSGGGHIGSYREKTRQFIDGCRKATKANERLEFH